jgi:hypothetical protein
MRMGLFKRRTRDFGVVPFGGVISDDARRAENDREAGYEQDAKADAEALMPHINRALEQVGKGKSAKGKTIKDRRKGNSLQVLGTSDGVAIYCYGYFGGWRLERALSSLYDLGYQVQGHAPSKKEPGYYNISIRVIG